MQDEHGVMRALRGLTWLLAGAGLVLLVGSFGGHFHPLGDSLAVLRWQLAAGVAGLAALLIGFGVRHQVAWLLVPASLALAQTGWAWFKPQHGADASIVVYQKNLWFRLRDRGPIIADILQVAPDLLTLQEVTPANRVVLQQLREVLPYQLYCPTTGRAAAGPAVASRWPVVEGTRICDYSRGIAALQVVTPDGPLWIVSLHLPWPWPYQHPKMTDQIVAALGRFQGPIVIGGDFNMVPWSDRNRRIAAATNTRRVGRAHNSFPQFGPLFPLPIDHIYAPEGAVGDTEVRPALGSDHRGLVAQIELP